eukprot:GEMP01090788.1.p1 GENE.GEMP01090788.1~~GEMP01090788.1.p1  ORF type:complete len:206 (+),score=38.30 GEMP01090788.1:91-618(+)
MDAKAKAAVHKADATYAKAVTKAWTAKAKAYAAVKAPMAKQPPPFPAIVLPVAAAGPGVGEVPHPGGGAAPLAAGPKAPCQYPYIAKAAAYQPNAKAQPMDWNHDPEDRVLKSRRISNSAITIAKAFSKTAKELHNPDIRVHYNPKATAATAALGTRELCASFEARLADEFGNDE